MTDVAARPSLKHRLEYWAARVAWGLFGLLPLDAASALGGWLGRVVGPRLGVTKVARDNLAHAFADKPDAEIETILRAMWDNLGRNLGELSHLPEIAEARVELVGREVLETLRDDGRPGLLFTAHLGNWEVASFAIARAGLTMHPVFREANNPLLADVYGRRKPDEKTVLVPKGAKGARLLIDLLKRGEHIGMLIDQKMNDGIAVPFFGREAMTAPALGQFAVRHDCPVAPVRVERLKGCHFRVTIYPPISVPKTGDRHADANETVARATATLESWIRERPEQWLWVHRRWPK